MALDEALIDDAQDAGLVSPEAAEAARRELEARKQELADRLAALAASLEGRRERVVAHRKNSGIEQEWQAAEDAYQGIDDANRVVVSRTQRKPSSPDGGYVDASRPEPGRSIVLPNITAPYVDAAAARVADMLLPVDDRPWSIEPTPLPEGVELDAAQQAAMQPPVAMPGSQPQVLQGQPEQMPPGMPQEAPGAMPGPSMQAALSALQQRAQELQRIKDEAKDAAEGAQEQIADWLEECQWHEQVRTVIEDAARLGSGVIKGPFPERKVATRVRVVEGAQVVERVSKIVPVSRAVSCWDIFPDVDCGTDIQQGSQLWERTRISAKALRELKEMSREDGSALYLTDEIDKVLTEDKRTNSRSEGNSESFELWTFYGVLEREDLEAAGAVDLPEDETVSAVISMIDGRVIKAAINPLDSGRYPFDVLPWRVVEDSPWGRGVAYQMITPQRIVTAGVRALMDNGGLISVPQIIRRKGSVAPADGRWNMTRGKVWDVLETADEGDVKGFLTAFNVPAAIEELHSIIQLGMKMAEDVTGLPLMMQGQVSPSTPATLGGQIMQHNNAGTTLRRLARMFDDRLTEPHLQRYYEYLMLYGEDDAIKGDFQIKARGSTALVERDLQGQAISQMGQLVLNPAFGIDPEKWFKEMLKAQRLTPERFLMDEDKKAQLQAMPPPEAPQIAAAKIRAEADAQAAQVKAQIDTQLAQLKSQTDLQIASIREQALVEKVRMDTDRDTIYRQTQLQREQVAAQGKEQELMLKRELAMLEYANREKISLDKVKADLTKKAMDINATRELVALNARADQLPKPPVEPPGLAPAGESFTK